MLEIIKVLNQHWDKNNNYNNMILIISVDIKIVLAHLVLCTTKQTLTHRKHRLKGQLLLFFQVGNSALLFTDKTLILDNFLKLWMMLKEKEF